MLMGPRNWFQGMNSASLCSLAGRYDNPIPPRFLAPIDFLKIPALYGFSVFRGKAKCHFRGHPTTQSRQSAKRFSSRWNWDSPTPLAAAECAPPPFGPGVGHTRLRPKGWGSPNSNEGTYTVVLYIYKYFVPYKVAGDLPKMWSNEKLGEIYEINLH